MSSKHMMQSCSPGFEWATSAECSDHRIGVLVEPFGVQLSGLLDRVPPTEDAVRCDHRHVGETSVASKTWEPKRSSGSARHRPAAIADTCW